MSADLLDLYGPEGGWTTDDLDRMPETTRHIELLDGALVVSPSPTYEHQTLAALLMVALRGTCPRDVAVTQGVEIRISRQRSLIPDVLAVSREALQPRVRLFQPHEVLLAVEIVSPTSHAMDRVLKPAMYAQTGIPYYWRVETDDGITVHTHRLDPGTGLYVATGAHSGTLDASEPWQLSLPLDRLAP